MADETTPIREVAAVRVPVEADLAEFERAWNDMFDRMEQRAGRIAEIMQVVPVTPEGVATGGEPGSEGTSGPAPAASQDLEALFERLAAKIVESVRQTERAEQEPEDTRPVPIPEGLQPQTKALLADLTLGDLDRMSTQASDRVEQGIDDIRAVLEDIRDLMQEQTD